MYTFISLIRVLVKSLPGEVRSEREIGVYKGPISNLLMTSFSDDTDLRHNSMCQVYDQALVTKVGHMSLIRRQEFMHFNAPIIFTVQLVSLRLIRTR